MKVVKVTPKKAGEWIQRNVNNRPVRRSRVDLYAGAMKSGAWKLNGDAIRFNGNGDLIDGQHRLLACISCGVPFETYVVHGIEHDAFDTIDQGDKRTTADVFSRHGYKHYTMLSAATRWVWRYEGQMHRHGAMRSDEANDIIERHPALHTATQKASEKGRNGLINPGLLAFLDYWTGQKDQDRADKFWLSVAEGDGLEKGTAAYLLHKRLVSNLASVAKLDPTTIAALCIKAWNAFVTKKPCGTLKWGEQEEFPTIIL